MFLIPVRIVRRDVLPPLPPLNIAFGWTFYSRPWPKNSSGKDRTGLVMALTLAALGVPDEAIVDDYAQSDAAYRELDDDDAMVGALAQVRTVLARHEHRRPFVNDASK